jgi:hypothetical protein
VLIARIYEVFPLLCPMCGGQMRLIAFIAAGTQIRTTLFHGEPVTRAGNPGFPRNLKPVPGCDTAARVLERP